MAALGDDCYFFCTSTCAKGPACPFRHVEAAKTCKIICQHWQMGGCFRPMCKFRHSDFKLNLDYGEILCYWESQLTGCTKLNCAYKHLKPRPQAETTSAVGDSSAIACTADGTMTTPTTSSSPSSTSQAFARPVVKPVIIQPAAESEDSNSSPTKRPTDDVPTEIKQNPDKTDSDRNEPQTEKNSEVKETDQKEKSSEPPPVNVVKKKVTKVKAGAQKTKVPKKVNVKNGAGKKAGANEAKKVKAKVATVKGTVKKKATVQKPKSVKERLGKTGIAKKQESGSGSDSDDSIENVKVMSMEEIFRQKALESMMKKRAAEGKAPLSVSQQEKFTNRPAKNRQTVRAFSESSSSEEESSSGEEEAEVEKPDQSSSASSSSSSDSSSSSSSESEDSDSAEYEPDVRRVIVDIDSEKSARKKAKASLVKKQKADIVRAKGRKVTKATSRLARQGLQGVLGPINKKAKALKKRMVDVDYDSDDIVSARVTQPLKLDVRARLGKPNVSEKNEDPVLKSRAAKFGLVSDVPKKSNRANVDSPRKTVLKTGSSSGSEEDDGALAGIKIKTLEEIKQEKMRKLAVQGPQSESLRSSSIKQRLGLTPANRDVDGGEEESKGRQVLIVNDSGSKSDDARNAKPSEEQKKAKRRPWRSQKRQLSGDLGGGDERTAVIKQSDKDIILTADSDTKIPDLGDDKEDYYEGESAFDRMRRRALMRKLHVAGTKKNKSASAGDVVISVTNVEIGGHEAEKEVAGEDSSGSKKHKHKHKHKRHKKTKVERQIYMPPAMKNSVTNITVKAAVSSNSSPTRKQPVTAPTAKVAPQKRGPHPIAAAWAAGLSLSAKGTPAHRPLMEPKPVIPEKLSVAERVGLKIVAAKPKATISSLPTTQSATSETSGVTIKSFAEIMAEKRKRRLELQAQKAGTAATSALAPPVPTLTPSSSSSSLTQPGSSPFNTSPAKPTDAKPRVPISPIVFGSDNSFNDGIKTAAQNTFVASQQSLTTGSAISSNAQSSFTFAPMPPVLSSSLTSMPPKPQGPEKASQKVKVKTGGKAAAASLGMKKKKAKLFKKRKSVDMSEESNLGYSEDSNSNISSSPLRSSSLQSIPSTSGISYLSETSQDTVPLSQLQSATPGTTRSSAVGATVDFTDGRMKTDFTLQTSHLAPPSGQETNGTMKQSAPLSPVETEPSKKKARLSMEDEFSFLEDGNLDEVPVTGDIEPIDDLLQDIDDLLA